MLVTVNFELSITISDKKPDCVDKSTLKWIGTTNQSPEVMGGGVDCDFLLISQKIII